MIVLSSVVSINPPNVVIIILAAMIISPVLTLRLINCVKCLFDFLFINYLFDFFFIMNLPISGIRLILFVLLDISIKLLKSTHLQAFSVRGVI